MTGQVIIIGVGALGSHLAMFGRNWKQGLKVIDFDRVEMKNIASQFHTNMGKGRNKALGLQQGFQGMFGIRVEAIPHKLTRDNAQALLSDAVLVIDCTDNAEARRVIQGYCKENKVPCVHGALAANGEFARVVWTSHFVIDEEDTGVVTCEDGNFLPFIAVSASWLAWSAQQFLSHGKQINFNIFPGGVFRF